MRAAAVDARGVASVRSLRSIDTLLPPIAFRRHYG